MTHHRQPLVPQRLRAASVASVACLLLYVCATHPVCAQQVPAATAGPGPQQPSSAAAEPKPATAEIPQPAVHASQPTTADAPQPSATGSSQMAVAAPLADLPRIAPPIPIENLPPTEALGDLLTMRGRYLTAIHVFEQLQPRTAMIANKQGVACERMLMFERARQNFQEAIRLDPRFADAYNNLATVYHSQNDHGRAEKLYRQSIKLRPGASAYQNLGALYFSELRFGKGEQAYREALKLDPHIMEHSAHSGVQATGNPRTSAEMHYHLACTFAQAGKPELALDYLRKCIIEGFHDSNRMLHQKELLDLQTTPDFLKMVEDLRKS